MVINRLPTSALCALRSDRTGRPAGARHPTRPGTDEPWLATADGRRPAGAARREAAGYMAQA